MTLSEELSWRGYAHQTTLKNVEDINTPRTFYLGVDPSAASMHIGNLAQVLLVKHLLRQGHKAIVLVGGATGMIGDPKDDAERDLKALEEIEHNKRGIASQYKRLLEGEPFELVDNYDWFKDINYFNVPTPFSDLYFKSVMEQGQNVDAFVTVNTSKNLNFLALK